MIRQQQEYASDNGPRAKTGRLDGLLNFSGGQNKVGRIQRASGNIGKPISEKATEMDKNGWEDILAERGPGG